MVPSTPPGLRRKLRTAYPIFGITDIAVRWVAPILIVLGAIATSWTLAVIGLGVLLVSWNVRARQLPVIVRGESQAMTSEQLPPVPFPSLERFYLTWPQLHAEYGHPAIAESVDVWCPQHEQWEAGELSARVIPPAFPELEGIFHPSLHIELKYGIHAWQFGSASFISRGEVAYKSSDRELLEVRSTDVVDKNRYDGSDDELAVAVLLELPNNWSLVTDEMPKTPAAEALARSLEVPIPNDLRDD